MRNAAAPCLSCFQCPTRHQAEWHVLSDKALALVDERKRTAALEADTAVFLAGEPTEGLFCMHRGNVVLRRTDEQGNTALVKLAHDGQTFGVYEYFNNAEYVASAETLTDSIVCFVERAVVQELLQTHPALSMAFMQHLSQDLKTAHAAYLQIASLPLRRRLVHLLLHLRPYFGHQNGDGTLVVELPMTQLTIAEILGARRETVVRAFQAMHSEGLLEYDDGRVTIPDPDRFQREAQDPE